jgi:hypothetical protein
MSNTLGGVNLAQIAQQSLDVLVPQLVPLSIVTTDFSDEVASSGASVSTRLPTALTGVSNIETLGYAGSVEGVTTTVKTVTLGNLSGLVVGFTDTEWSKSKINLMDVFIKPGINLVAKQMQDALFALFTNSNYSNKVTVTAAAFDSDDVADIAEDATILNWPGMDRAMVLAPSYFNALTKDESIKHAYAYGGNSVITRRELPAVAGFSPIIEYSALPTNSENLYGVALNKQAAVIASRLPAVPGNFPGEIQNVTDPDSGFSIQLRKWYSADDGKYYMSMGHISGAAVGNGSAAIRIVSA